ncbi:phosphohistidine phosphatase SixA [Patescibacteria group bacterium]|nr:phosphohistidine phosphatase SixA [Patescibacteria group bacterium]
MKLYLVRHATQNDEDPEKRLTEKGLEEAKKMATYLAETIEGLKIIYHSEKPRAVQTAQEIAKALNVKMTLKEGIKPMDDVRPIASWIDTLTEDTMIVGHMPFLSRLSSLLLNGNEEADHLFFSTAGTICLERKSDNTWYELWMTDPSII